MAGLVVAIGSVILLALWADRLTLVSFQVLLLLIGAGFGPTPSMASVVVQNVVERHHFGIAFGTMNFSRNLFSTILIAILGALVLAVTSSLGPGAGGELARRVAAGQRRGRRGVPAGVLRGRRLPCDFLRRCCYDRATAAADRRSGRKA